VEALGIERVTAILAGGARAALEAAIAEDLAVAPHVAAIAEVEKLARCHRDFFTLANNFVAFTDFYARRKAIFQAGTLYLDGRSCDLCVEVTDPAKHGTLAAMAGTYLAYMNCTRPSGEKKQIAAAITSAIPSGRWTLACATSSSSERVRALEDRSGCSPTCATPASR